MWSGCTCYGCCRATFINVFFAVVIGVALTIPKQALERWGVWRAAALGLSTLLMLTLLVMLIVLIAPALLQQSTELVISLGPSLSALSGNYAELSASNSILGAILPPLPSQVSQALDPAAARADLANLISSLLTGAVPPILQGIGLVAGLILQFAFLALLGLWFAGDPGSILNGLLYLYPRNVQPRVVEVWNTLYHELAAWLKAQTISILITMVLVYVILGLLLGLPYALRLRSSPGSPL